MFVELLVRGGGTTTINSDKVVSVERVAYEGDPRCVLVIENSPDQTVLYTVEDTLALLAGRKVAND